MNKFTIAVIVLILGIIGVVTTLASAALSDNLKIAYNLNESSGTNAINSINLSNNGTFNIAPTWTVGLINNSARTTGTQYLDTNRKGTAGDWSINLWVNSSSGGGLIGNIYEGGGLGFFLRTGGNSVQLWGTGVSGWTFVDSTTTSTITLNNNRWHMITLVYNSTSTTNNVDLYIDGTERTLNDDSGDISLGTDNLFFYANGGPNNYFVGSMDSITYFERRLTSVDVTNLYNAGNGMQHPYDANVTTVSVSLTSPTNGQTTQGVGAIFNATIYGYNITNASIYVYHANGTLFNRTNVNFASANRTEYFSLYVNSFSNVQYKWNVLGCGINESTKAKICAFATANFTFFSNSYEVSQTYQPVTTEGATETFIFNSTYDSTIYTSTATLVYNNTRYSGIKTGTGNNVLFTKSITIPKIESAQLNKTFYWELALTNTTGRTYVNSTSNNQSIYSIAHDNCTTYTLSFINFTLYDEDTRGLIVGSGADNKTIKLDVSIKSLDKTFSESTSVFENGGKNTSLICLSSSYAYRNATYALYYTAQYSTTLRSIETMVGQNITLNNNTVILYYNLYDILDANSDQYSIRLKNVNLLPLEGAVVEIYRYYPEIGQTYLLVEAPISDALGYAGANLDSWSTTYSLYIKKEGQTVGIYENIIPQCNPTISECIINLNPQLATYWFESSISRDSITYNEAYDKVLKEYSFTYNILNSVARNVTTIGTDYLLGTTLCSDDSNKLSDTLTCDIADSYGNRTVQFTTYVDNIIYLRGSPIYIDYSISSSLSEVRWIFIAALIPLLAIMGYASITISVIMFILGLIILTGVFFTGSSGYTIMAPWILFIIIALIIMIIKYNKRGSYG